MKYSDVDIYSLTSCLPHADTPARLRSYIHDISAEIDSNRLLPCILVLPGGGYGFTSEREAEPVALRFFGLGYNVFVLNYSIAPDKYPIALKQAAWAIEHIRTNPQFSCNGKVYAIGFSAGAHLCGCLGVLWNEAEVLDIKSTLCRPDGVMLAYPVISSGEYAHSGSFENLCGSDCELAAVLSLEKRVTPDSVPAFIWHTADDQLVSVQNSLLLAAAYSRAGVPFELHVFPHGQHGLSMCDKTTSGDGTAVSAQAGQWVNLAVNWLAAL